MSDIAFRGSMSFGGFRSMWVMVLFDLPTDSQDARRDYRVFREMLLESGFIMLQFSVYTRHCSTEEKADALSGRVLGGLPEDGQVRVFTMTDKQFERMKVYVGKIKRKNEAAPEQLSFF